MSKNPRDNNPANAPTTGQDWPWPVGVGVEVKESMYDFGDGPVPAHKHPNGGGWVADTATVDESAYIGPDAKVYDSARVYGIAHVYGSARVSGGALVCGSARVSGSALVSGSARVCGSAHVCGSAVTENPGDYLSLSGFALAHAITWTKSDDSLQIGCQRATVAEWRARGKGEKGEFDQAIFDVLTKLFG